MSTKLVKDFSKLEQPVVGVGIKHVIKLSDYINVMLSRVLYLNPENRGRALDRTHIMKIANNFNILSLGEIVIIDCLKLGYKIIAGNHRSTAILIAHKLGLIPAYMYDMEVSVLIAHRQDEARLYSENGKTKGFTVMQKMLSMSFPIAKMVQGILDSVGMSNVNEYFRIAIAGTLCGLRDGVSINYDTINKLKALAEQACDAPTRKSLEISDDIIEYVTNALDSVKQVYEDLGKMHNGDEEHVDNILKHHGLLWVMFLDYCSPKPLLDKVPTKVLAYNIAASSHLYKQLFFAICCSRKSQVNMTLSLYFGGRGTTVDFIEQDPDLDIVRKHLSGETLKPTELKKRTTRAKSWNEQLYKMPWDRTPKKKIEARTFVGEFDEDGFISEDGEHIAA